MNELQKHKIEKFLIKHDVIISAGLLLLSGLISVAGILYILS